MNQKYKKWVMSEAFARMYKALPSELRKVVRHQIPRVGSGGGGNHFAEIQKDQENNVYVMLHFGSRNLGHQIGGYYNKIAKELNKLWHTSVPEAHNLAFLPVGSEEGRAYLSAMELCLHYAKFNHVVVAGKVENVVNVTAQGHFIDRMFAHHNYARMENHFGQNVMVHRKGATSVQKGEFGIIPGSQGSKSYIVKGKGNKESFGSCSHGAGRKMGRKEAERTLNLEEEIKKLDDQGILHAIRGIHDLDEASGAYKSIDEVMENQKDLVDILVELTPLGVIKG